MNISTIEKIIGSMNLIKIKKNAHDMRKGGWQPPISTPPPPPPPPPPPLLRLVGDAHRNLTKFLVSSLKVVPRPSFWTDEKPYKCIGSK